MKKETAIFIFLFVLWILIMLSCNPVNKVLADIEKVKVVRAATDQLWPCANDSLVFIHDSTEVINTEYLRDTLIEVNNDTTFVFYYDTVIVNKTNTKTVNTVVVDNRYTDSLNKMLVREAKLQGTISEQRFQYNKMKGERNLWRIVAAILFTAIIAIGVIRIKSIL
jgi:hypothetical protein